MRKINLILTAAITVTFLAHAIFGGLRLAGADSDSMKTLARVCLFLILLHVITASYLTWQTFKARRLSGAGYGKANLLFWIRRISGLTILIPLAMHLFIFMQFSSGDVYRLSAFTTGRMISQIIFIAAVALHLLTNIRPLLISFGIKGTRSAALDCLLVLSVLLLLFAAAFAIYWLRWAAL